MLLGNDLADRQVAICPSSCQKPVVHETCNISSEMWDLYPESVVTRDMTNRARGEPEEDEIGVQSDSGVAMSLSKKCIISGVNQC